MAEQTMYLYPDGQTDEWTDGRQDRRQDGRTDRQG
jgi:hypothetical protein